MQTLRCSAAVVSVVLVSQFVGVNCQVDCRISTQVMMMEVVVVVVAAAAAAAAAVVVVMAVVVVVVVVVVEEEEEEEEEDCNKSLCIMANKSHCSF